jgi:predicted TIM-barrel fold metal-dependent hydrolase
MEYRCISADCHIDLSWLPHDLFVAHASQAMKDRMPYVIQDNEGLKWVTQTGAKLGFAQGKGSGRVVTSLWKYVPGSEHRLDRMASTGLYDDGAEGIRRPTTPALRLKDQERDGIQAEVIYGLLGAGTKMTDREASVEFYRIYNDWLADFCSYDRTRFVGLASIPSHSVDEGVKEAKRAARLGLGGLDVSFSYDMLPLWHPQWDPLWQAASEVNLPVHFHTVRGPPGTPVPPGLPKTYDVVENATRMAGFQLFLTGILASIINGGALERYPNLRIVLGESGIGWIPYVLQRMDDEYEDRFRTDLPLRMKPSEYWRRQCRATFQNDPVGTKLLDELGVENVMWGSDYPHPDGVFPDSQEYIERQFARLPAPAKRKITCENAGRFYGLIN